MKMPELEASVRKMLSGPLGLPEEHQVLAMVSGGGDSVALALLLHTCGRLGAVAHVHHGLRAEADAEEALVRELATRLGVEVHVCRLDPGQGMAGQSVQAWARGERYRFMDEVLDRTGLPWAATAHHRDDAAETVLMGILRSRDERAFRGVPLKRGRVIRPLLHLPKANLLAYCHAMGEAFLEDASNLDEHYLRNKLRHSVMPVLREVNPRIEERLLELANDRAVRDAWMDALLDALRGRLLVRKAEGEQFHFAAANEAVPPVPLELGVAWWLRQHGVTGQEIRRAVAHVEAHVGTSVVLGGQVLWRNHEGLLLSALGMAHQHEGVTLITEEGTVRMGGWELAWGGEPCTGDGWVCHTLDRDVLRMPLEARVWRQGDRIRPTGMAGSKKLSDVFAERHAGAWEKANALVVADADGEVLLLSGYRPSRIAMRHEGTARVMFLCYRPAEPTV